MRRQPRQTELGRVIRGALAHMDELRELASQGCPTVECDGLAVSVFDLERLLEQLPARQREAVQLVVLEDLPVADVARRMGGIASATVSQYAGAALEQIAASYFGDDLRRQATAV
jgi:DNA-directed RNA polymerase specialized sigma24 family protein